MTNLPRPKLAVRIEGLGYAYGRGRRTVDDVSLAVEPGRVHCLLGESGSGKTTLLRLVAGFETPDVGTIEIGGKNIADVSPERRPVGFVFQDAALFPHLSALRNVAFGMTGGTRRGRREAAAALLDRVGMGGFEQKMPHTLSGGQQQRVALARAMARGPRVMLLDEPFSGLDLEMRDRVREDALTLLRESGVATILVTHDPREALVAADAVSVMRSGRLLVTGKPGEICVCQPDVAGASVIRVCQNALARAEAARAGVAAPCDTASGAAILSLPQAAPSARVSATSHSKQ
jgi:iron(III) transport system ATP-binding protein